MSVITRFFLALSYLTSLPGLPKPQSEDELYGLGKFLPAVGLFIGAFLLGIFLVLRSLAVNELLSAFLLVLGWLLITGAIHIDGLMDSADGIFSHRSRERMLEIMRDSRVGNFGVISGLMTVLAKLSAIASLPDSMLVYALLFVPSWARFVELVIIVLYPYAREEGMGKIWRESSKPGDLIPAILPTIILSGLLSFTQHSFIPLIVIPLVVSSGLAIGHAVNIKLGGHTGDTYGASVEFSEAAGLLLLALIAPLVCA